MGLQPLRAAHNEGNMEDFFGDSVNNTANRSQTHGVAVRAWYNAKVAVAEGPVVLGDKDAPQATNDFNEGYVCDIGEADAGPGGRGVVTEVKVFTPLKAKTGKGKGSAKYGGTELSCGEDVMFGDTEEDVRLKNLGCKERGNKLGPVFNHATGKGWVAARKGLYHDALFVKHHKVDLLLHETIGGGFSPPAVVLIHKLSKKAAEGIDRTRYTAARTISFMTHHTSRLSIGIVRENAKAISKEMGLLASGKRKASRTSHTTCMGPVVAA